MYKLYCSIPILPAFKSLRTDVSTTRSQKDTKHLTNYHNFASQLLALLLSILRCTFRCVGALVVGGVGTLLVGVLDALPLGEGFLLVGVLVRELGDRRPLSTCRATFSTWLMVDPLLVGVECCGGRVTKVGVELVLVALRTC